MLNLFVDPAIPAKASFAQVKAQAFALLESAQFPLVSNYMRNIEFDKIGFEWDYYTAQSMAFKRNLRHLFADLEFAGRVEDAPLLEALVFLQDLLRRGIPPSQINQAKFPDAVIPKSLRRYLFTPPAGKGKPKRLLVDRYEFLVYRLVRNALEAGDVYVKNSNEFRRFEDDLISDARWKDKDAVLREIGAPLLMAPIEETLAGFRETLEAKFASVNERIDSGENKHIKVTGRADNRRWTLIYPSEDEPTNSPFYGQLPGIGIADLLWFVAGKTGFLKSCTTSSTAMSNMPLTRGPCWPASSRWAPTWDCGRWPRSAASATRRWRRPLAIFYGCRPCMQRTARSAMRRRRCRRSTSTTSTTRCIRRATATFTRRCRRWSGSSIRSTTAITSSNRHARSTRI